jgi:hypothetical protein
VEGHTGVHDLVSWNILKLAGDPAELPEARGVAVHVLDERLRAFGQTCQREILRDCDSMSAGPGTIQSGLALSIDWNHLFEEGHADGRIWREWLLPALSDVAAAIEKRLPGRPLIASGYRPSRPLG